MKILVCEPGKHPYVKDIPHELHEMQAVVVILPHFPR